LVLTDPFIRTRHARMTLVAGTLGPRRGQGDGTNWKSVRKNVNWKLQV